MTDPKLTFAAFESLGGDGEFGMVQRRAGIEKLGLFRFACTPNLPALTAAVETGLGTFGLPGDVCLFAAPTGTLLAYSIGFSVLFPIPQRWGDRPAQVVLRNMLRRTALLKRKFLEDLAIADRIYVRRGQPGELPHVAALGKALRRFGPNMLLWVTEADAEHPAGGIEILPDGIIVGRIGPSATGGAVTDETYADWIAVCEQCLLVVRGGQRA
jgi:hypothetical protein